MRKSVILLIVTMLAVGTFAFVPTFAGADTTTYEKVWVRMGGIINQWGDQKAFGWINAFVRSMNLNGTIREWARVHAVWSTDLPHMQPSNIPVADFTLIHYAAILINTTDIKFNGTDYDLSVMGLWNVTKITVSFHFNQTGHFMYINRTVEPYLPDLAEGEFKVTDHWRTFELNIAGMPMLSGLIFFHRMAFVEIKLFDLNDDGKVDIRELVRVARRYKSAPGAFQYDNDADVNNDGQVDIGDLATIGANIE